MAKLLRGSQAWLSKVESGKLEISAQHLFLLRAIFGISSDAILDGTIPYYQISLRMNSEALLPDHYTDQPNVALSSFYPVLTALAVSKNKTIWPSVCRQLKVKNFVFSDPQIRVNDSFLKLLLENAKLKEYFGKPSNFEDLKAAIASSWSGPGKFPLSHHFAYNGLFLADWMEWMTHASFNLSGALPDLGLSREVNPQFRSLSSQVS